MNAIKEFGTHQITRYAVGTPTKIDANSSPIAKEFYDFYHTKGGTYTPQSQDPKLDAMSMFSSGVKFINFYPFEDLDSISPRLIFPSRAMRRTLGGLAKKPTPRPLKPKELYYVKGAGLWIYTTTPSTSPLTKSRNFSKKISM
ncbi:hypothetical protein NHP190003_10500 [Helicobacter sp. NHP19-003]|uniref:Uncharacterized protein n=1 Tax=Helicobacter gastrocanis TaxID=2849641 RepID=A0ABN6I2H5_9HELI|nr:hypothetical protein [Helicobacter sp. NHP19-003]BCZ17768.1 hypothetical protein NHP190003_10500 [Helicobacter sp. NHP19-003]